MDQAFFKTQIERLNTQWPNSYKEERMMVIFNAFRDVSNFDFRDAVTHCLGNSKGSPLVPELTDALQKVRANYFNQKRIDEATQRGIFNSIPDGGTCDKEFYKKCTELYNALIDKKITKEQFDQGCDLLDQAAKLYKRAPVPTKTNLPEKYLKPVFEDDKPF